MSDELTPGEVGRALGRIERNLDELRSGFDGWREIVIEMRHQVAENTKDIGTIQEERKTEAVQRKADRRLLFTALIAPVAVLVLGFGVQIMLSAVGYL